MFRLQDHYLHSIKCSLKDEGSRNQFWTCVLKMKDPTCPKPERSVAQEHVWGVCVDRGLLVLHGDLLTMERSVSYLFVPLCPLLSLSVLFIKV